MGLDIQSFYQLTPDEFETVYTRWSDARDSQFRNGWEQTRMKCYYSAAPYMKSKVSAKAFMPFPWEKKGAAPEPGAKAKREKAVKDPERFKALKQRYGSTI